MRSHEWREQRACNGVPVEVFFPAPEVARRTAYNEARAICLRCPVRLQCLEDVMAEEGTGFYRDGYRGGMSPSQRHEEMKRRRRSA